VQIGYAQPGQVGSDPITITCVIPGHTLQVASLFTPQHGLGASGSGFAATISGNGFTCNVQPTTTNGAGGTSCTGEFISGTTLTLSVTVNWSGVTFTGWSGACSGTSTCTVTMNSNVNITANFND
jgi:uncharacterized repeat protein (TIGR02543 family)